MVAKASIITAAEKIDAALKDFVEHRAEAKTLVFVNELGTLHALVASPGFAGIPKKELTDRIWEYLRANVPSSDLGHLYRIEAMTAEEYEARLSKAVFQSGAAGELGLDF